MNIGALVALLGLGLTTTTAGITALWKLATMLAEVRSTVRGELSHNGGGSTKDYAMAARDEAMAARRAAEHAHRRLDNLEAVVTGLRIDNRVETRITDMEGTPHHD